MFTDFIDADTLFVPGRIAKATSHRQDVSWPELIATERSPPGTFSDAVPGGALEKEVVPREGSSSKSFSNMSPWSEHRQDASKCCRKQSVARSFSVTDKRQMTTMKRIVETESDIP